MWENLIPIRKVVQTHMPPAEERQGTMGKSSPYWEIWFKLSVRPWNLMESYGRKEEECHGRLQKAVEDQGKP